MSASWSADDFRVARMALIGVSAASFVPLLTEDDALAIPAAICLHLGLGASLALERGDWLARTIGAVFLLPSSIIAAVLANIAIWHVASGGWEPVLVTPALAFALAHIVQLWRLAGLPIPPLHPLASSVTDDATESIFHPHAAPGHRAERIAAP